MDARTGGLAALLAACGRDASSAAVRDAAIIALLYSTRMRRAELVGLNREDYDSETGTLKVRRGKGRKERLVYAVGGAHAALADWLVVRGDGPGALFVAVNKGGRLGSGRITAQAIYNLLDKRVREARLGLPLSPHDLRRTFIVMCADCGHENVIDQREVEDRLGR